MMLEKEHTVFLTSVKMRYKRATPKGYRHIWRYHGRWDETKLTPRKWRFRFRATKGKKSKGYGGFGKGFWVKWKIDGIQTAYKTNKGTYQTDLRGTKTLIKSGNKRRYA